LFEGLDGMDEKMHQRGASLAKLRIPKWLARQIKTGRRKEQ